jgi:hypothetical protein
VLKNPKTKNKVFISTPLYSISFVQFTYIGEKMENNNLDNIDEQQLQEAVQKHNDYIIELNPTEILERLSNSLEATEVILEGYNLVTNINEGHGIAVAGLIRLREAVAESITWISENVGEFDEEMLEEIVDEL